MKTTLKRIFLAAAFCIPFIAEAQPTQKKWVRQQLRKMSTEERIAQLMVVRVSEETKNGVRWYDDQIEAWIKKYNVGSLCVFQGGPVEQAKVLNRLQAAAKTPLLVTVDAEWGLAMRIKDSVMALPRQLTLGATNDTALAYAYGQLLAKQCKRLGIQVDYAPVVDVNNNPNNPVINDRSFGEDKEVVANMAAALIRGMQDGGVMACAKHFPGHGDTEVDSHYDLPVINKSLDQLEQLEFYPFRKVVSVGVGSIMVAHLYIPSIDNTPNRATSLSANNVNGLLRNNFGYEGLTFTDALEMKGVAKFFPSGEASVQALLAGNDMLCLPGNVDTAIAAVMKAIQEKRLSKKMIEAKTKKVLAAKYQYGLWQKPLVDTVGLYQDLNEGVLKLRETIVGKAVTLARNETAGLLPLAAKKPVFYLGVGIEHPNELVGSIALERTLTFVPVSKQIDQERIKTLIDSLQNHPEVTVVVGIHNYSSRPGANKDYGLTPNTRQFLNAVGKLKNVVLVFNGNPYAAQYACEATNIVINYEDSEYGQLETAKILLGQRKPQGQLPVTVCPSLPMGTKVAAHAWLPITAPEAVGMNSSTLQAIDTIVADAVKKKQRRVQ